MKSKKKKPLFLIFILVVILILVFCVLVYFKGKTGPYLSITDDGYKTVQTGDVKFQIHKDCLGNVQAEKLSNEMKDSEAYVVANNDLFISTLFSKYLIYLTEMDITNTEDLTYELKEFERHTGIRIKNSDLMTSGTKKIPYVKKLVYQCQAEAMLTKNLYGDFTGYLTMLHTDEQSYFMFAGVSDSVEKPEKAMDALWNSVMSASYTTFIELRNPSEKQEEAKEIDYESELGILESELVDFGEYGYLNVINKSDETAYVRIAGKVESLINGSDAETVINDKIGQTIYKDLPDADVGNQWNVVVISYNTLGYDMSKVPPVIPIRVYDEYGEFNLTDVYTLQADYQTHKIQIFYQLPAEITDYQLVLGEKAKDIVPLSVLVSDESVEKSSQESKQNSESEDDNKTDEETGDEETE